MSFQQFYGLGPDRLQPSELARIPGGAVPLSAENRRADHLPRRIGQRAFRGWICSAALTAVADARRSAVVLPGRASRG